MELAEFCKFYPGMTPKDYWDLTIPEYEVMRAYLRKWVDDEKQAMNKVKSRSRR